MLSPQRWPHVPQLFGSVSVSKHATQEPAFAPLGAQSGVSGRDEQSTSLEHARQTPSRHAGMLSGQPRPLGGSQMAQRPSARQKGSAGSVHSACAVHPRQMRVLESQMGAVGVGQPAAAARSAGSQPTQAPDAMHELGAGQLSGTIEHPVHVPATSHTGAVPSQPELSAGLQSTHAPSTHC